MGRERIAKKVERLVKHLLILVVIDSAIWLIWSFIVGYLVTKIPLRTLDKKIVISTNAATAKKLDAFWKIRVWKDWVPELGSFFKDGTTKRNLQSLNHEGLVAFRRETCRAELAHYLFMVILPVFFFFNPSYLILAMVVYAVVANIPFILIQRYNRSRIDAIFARFADK